MLSVREYFEFKRMIGRLKSINTSPVELIEAHCKVEELLKKERDDTKNDIDIISAAKKCLGDLSRLTNCQNSIKRAMIASDILSSMKREYMKGDVLREVKRMN